MKQVSYLFHAISSTNPICAHGQKNELKTVRLTKPRCTGIGPILKTVKTDKILNRNSYSSDKFSREFIATTANLD